MLSICRRVAVHKVDLNLIAKNADLKTCPPAKKVLASYVNSHIGRSRRIIDRCFQPPI